MLVHWSTRCRMECWSFLCASRRGITSSLISFSISKGTPGRAMSTLLSCSIHRPGAVPNGLESTVQSFGTKACWRLVSVKSMPREAKISVTCFNVGSSMTSSRWKMSQMIFLVMSSLVGPRPPVMMTTSVLARDEVTVSRMAWLSSPMVMTSVSSNPAADICCPMKAALVLTTCPMSSSSPMLISIIFSIPFSFHQIHHFQFVLHVLDVWIVRILFF